MLWSSRCYDRLAIMIILPLWSSRRHHFDCLAIAVMIILPSPLWSSRHYDHLAITIVLPLRSSCSYPIPSPIYKMLWSSSHYNCLVITITPSLRSSHHYNRHHLTLCQHQFISRYDHLAVTIVTLALYQTHCYDRLTITIISLLHIVLPFRIVSPFWSSHHYDCLTLPLTTALILWILIGSLTLLNPVPNPTPKSWCNACLTLIVPLSLALLRSYAL